MIFICAIAATLYFQQIDSKDMKYIYAIVATALVIDAFILEREGTKRFVNEDMELTKRNEDIELTKRSEEIEKTKQKLLELMEGGPSLGFKEALDLGLMLQDTKPTRKNEEVVMKKEIPIHSSI